MIRRGIWLAAVLAGLAPWGARADRMSLAHFDREISLDSPQISPDGRSVAVVRERRNLEDNRFERTLMLVEVATGIARVMTPARSDVAAPRWSPQGDRLAFLDADELGRKQVHVLPLAGGEAVRLTEAPSGVRAYAWSPDGRAIGFTTPDLAPAPAGEEPHNRSFEVGDHDYLLQAAPTPSHLWVLRLDVGSSERLTSGPWTVGQLHWSPDGNAIAYEYIPGPASGDIMKGGGIALLDLASRQTRVLFSGSHGYTLTLAGFSPDGRWCAFSHRNEPRVEADVYVVSVSDGMSRIVDHGLDRDVRSRWLRSGELLLHGPDLTRIGVWTKPLAEPLRRMDLGAVDPVSDEISASDGGVLAFVGQEAHRPDELYVRVPRQGGLRRLTDLNGDIAALTLGRVEEFQWDGPDGFRENGVLVHPPGSIRGKRYPLVLYIHGGPRDSSIAHWDNVAQLFAARDWIVFRPNYRGSNNTGRAYQRAIIGDAGDGPGRDVMSGVDALKRRGIVDESRMAVSGRSYGGYMTVWIAAHFPGWRAAVAGAAVTDLFDQYNLSDLNVYFGSYFGGLGKSPWVGANWQDYWRQSPIAHAHRIRAPTLIFSTTGDPRVPVTESYKLFHALKDNGVPVKFVAYPTGEHVPPDPIHQRDVYRRWMEWIAHHFDGGS